MACSKENVIVMQCLIVLLVLLTASTTQGRSSHRIHNRRNGGLRSLANIEFDEEMMEEMEKDLPALHSRRQHSRRQHSGHHGNLIQKVIADYEEIVRASEEEQQQKSAWSSEQLHALRKRHNKARRGLVREMISEQEESEIENSLAKNIHRHNIVDKTRRKRFEVELREAQNSSLCNYTVTEIRDTSEDQSRIPKHLVDVKCNHAGLKCREPGTHYCLQTYGKVEVSYSNGTTEVLKILTGCVCALRQYGQLEQFRPHIVDEWNDAQP